MTTTAGPIDHRILDFLAEGPELGPEAGFERAMAVTRMARQRPAWTLPVWWLPEAAGARGTRLVIVLALVLLGALAVAVALVGGRREAVVPPPEAVAMAPPTVVLWLELINERPETIEFEWRGAVTYPLDGPLRGGSPPCRMWVPQVELGSPWTVTVDGRVVLSSDQPSAAFAGMADGGEVTLRVRATRDGELEVSELEAGRNVVPRTEGPAPACAGYVEPAPGVEIPEAFNGAWRVTAPATGSLTGGPYQVELIDGWAARPIRDWEVYQGDLDGPDSEFDWVQGTIQALHGDEMTLGASAICETTARYRWALSNADSTITLTPLDDGCPERRALLASGPLERHPPISLDTGQPLGAGRYVARDFEPAYAFTVPRGLTTALSSSDGPVHEIVGDERVWFLRTPGLGWEIRGQANATPATCNGPERWLTGEPNPWGENETPQAITDLDVFTAAFEAWDRDHPDVTVGAPRDLTISGRPAVAVDVVAQARCTNEPGLKAGNILERDIAVQLPGRVLLISFGPAVFLSGEETDPQIYLERFYDESLIDLGEAFARTVEILEAP